MLNELAKDLIHDLAGPISTGQRGIPRSAQMNALPGPPAVRTAQRTKRLDSARVRVSRCARTHVWCGPNLAE